MFNAFRACIRIAIGRTTRTPARILLRTLREEPLELGRYRFRQWPGRESLLAVPLMMTRCYGLDADERDVVPDRPPL
ncbi:hypothetical protein FXF53_13955 [Micromonospora sp. WP24]|uniref:hypothetical protein n=1 Tax=Micromonospora sp. WP24 TaxID=2604469 RepID=UPI0011D3CB0D|nr:hypothetical protein [Micromonospora sp. WP24]TYC00277.1 hypothetical protein FXF53_13955 [Micromonospora sp. WP24]